MMKYFVLSIILAACGTNEIQGTNTIKTAPEGLIDLVSLEFGENAAKAKAFMEKTPLVYNACCESCHEDDIDYGYDICTTDFDIPGKSVTVLHCCKAKPSQEDVEKRAKELYENE